MAKKTKIEWADRTFSPWEGCQKVGPGCDHCYAEAGNARYVPKASPLRGTAPNWGPGAERRVMSDAYWRDPWKWDRELGEQGRRETVFPSLCDPFDNAAPAGQRERFANLIMGTPNLEWLLLTKRIGNVVDMLAEMFPNGVPKNVRIGATIVNQAEYDRDQSKIAAAYVATGRKVFLSCEPLLGPVKLHSDRYNMPRVIGWIIAGGESGPEARPMHPDWARGLRDQATEMRIPFMFKQWGEWAPAPSQDTREGDCMMMAWPEGTDGFLRTGVMMRKYGKKAAGRTLDGVEHTEFPND